MSTPLVERVRIPLVLADRCDQCGAQAFVRVSVPRVTTTAGELLFCGHHYAQHELVFISSAYDVDDQRHRINEKPNEPTEQEASK